MKFILHITLNTLRALATPALLLLAIAGGLAAGAYIPVWGPAWLYRREAERRGDCPKKLLTALNAAVKPMELLWLPTHAMADQIDLITQENRN